MKGVLGIAVAAAFVAAAFFGWTYVQGLRAKNAFLEDARRLSGELLRKKPDGPGAAEEAVRELLAEWEGRHHVKPAGDDAVAIRTIGLDITGECTLPDPPPELGLLVMLDQGNVNNRVVRCLPTSLVGFTGTFVTENGRRFDATSYTWVAGR